MSGAPGRHLVAVWNPSYASDAMEATLQLLVDCVRSHRSGARAEEDVYVWWGKVRSANRQQPLVHLPEILALDEELQGDDGPRREVHLYLTDYRSLYVGHVAEVTADDVVADDAAHVPAFYKAGGMSCDCWFKLWDLRRLVHDDTLATVEALKQLRNTRYHDRPVSMYGGMVELPLLVTREDDARYFDADVRDRLIEGRFWVEFDAERSGIGRMERELRENVLGEEAWRGFDPAARVFIATAEDVFRSHRDDPAFDFSPVVVDFAKAFEVQVSALVRGALRRAAPAERQVNVNGRTVDVLADGVPRGLGDLARLIAEEQSLNRALKRHLVHGDWFAASLPPILRDLADSRNPAAHTTRVTRERATTLRNRLLGVGCLSVLVELGRVRVP